MNDPSASLFLHIRSPRPPALCLSGLVHPVCTQLIGRCTVGAPPQSSPSKEAFGCGAGGSGCHGPRLVGDGDTTAAGCPAQTRPPACGTPPRGWGQWLPGTDAGERRPWWNGGVVAVMLAACSWHWSHNSMTEVGSGPRAWMERQHRGPWVCCARCTMCYHQLLCSVSEEPYLFWTRVPAWETKVGIHGWDRWVCKQVTSEAACWGDARKNMILAAPSAPTVNSFDWTMAMG